MAADRAADQLGPDEPADQAEATEATDAAEQASPAEAADPADAAPPADAGPGSGSRGAFAVPGGVPLLVGLVALVVAALVAVGVLGAQAAQASAERENRAEALRVSRQLIVNFTTLDYRSYDTDMKRVQQLAAGDLAKQSSNVFTELRKVMATNKMVSKGKVLDAGLVSFDQDSARALVVADSDVTNVLTKQPEARHYRFQLDLSKEPEGWRVVDLQVVG